MLTKKSLIICVSLCACTPVVQEVRTIPANARPATCELELLQTPMQEVLLPGSKWEMVGSVIVSERGISDPLNSPHKEEIRARACTMGGEAIVVGSQSMPVSGVAFAPDTSSTMFYVMRKRLAPSKTPQKF